MSAEFDPGRRPTNEKTPHAGGEEVPADVREQPISEFRLPLRDAHAQGLIGEVPDTASELRQPDVVHSRTDYFPPDEKKERRGFKRTIQAAVVGLVAVGAVGAGVFVGRGGLGNNKEETEPKDQPVAAAPVTPGGEQAQVAPPPPSEVVSANPNTLRPDFEYQVGGMKYKTLEEFIASIDVDVEKYPGGADALKRIIDVEFNQWLLAAANIEEHRENRLYQSDPNTPAGAPSLSKDIYDPAFTSALVTGSAPGFIPILTGRHEQVVSDVLQSPLDAVQYTFGYNFKDLKSEINTHDEYHAWGVEFDFKDNGSQVPRIAKKRSEYLQDTHSTRSVTELDTAKYNYSIALKKVENEQGKLVWKISGMVPTPTK